MKNDTGFTLIEVLIALSVVAIGLTAVLNSSLHSAAHANLLQQKIFALWVLENKAAEIRLNEKNIPTANDEGEQQQAEQAWQWKTETKDTPNPKIKKVELAIFAPAEQNQEEALLQQNLYLRVQQP